MRERSSMRDQQIQYSPRRKEVGMLPTATGKTRSMSDSLVARSPTTPTRATFPFKPACAMAAMQKSETPHFHHATANKTNAGLGSDHDICQLPAIFRPRPSVTTLSLQHPRRCATYPFDSRIKKQLSSPSPKLRDGSIPGFKEKSFPPFPISIHSPSDGGCWWLLEMASIVARRPSDIVQEGAVEIELVEPGESFEIELVQSVESTEATLGDRDVVEEVQVKISVTADKGDKTDCIPQPPKELNESIAKSDTTSMATPHYSFEDKAKLQEKLKDLRAEMDHSKDVDPEKRRHMEKMFKQVEGAIKMHDAKSGFATLHEQNKTQFNESTPSTIDHIRRTTVAITGGTLTVAGVVLIPCPVIPGCLVVYGGLVLLATEFDSAKKALDVVRGPLEQWLADDEGPKANVADNEKYSSFRWEEMIGRNPDECQSGQNEIDDEFMAMLESDKVNEGDQKIVADGKMNSLKPILRKILNLDSTVDGGTAMRDDGIKDETRGNRLSVPDDSNHPQIVHSEPSDTVLTPQCEIDLSNCKIFSFGCWDDVNEVIIDKSITHVGQHGIECSIALNTFDDDDAGGEPIRLFSRENTVDGSYNEVIIDKSEAHARNCSEGSITLNTMDDDAGGETVCLFSSQKIIGSSYGNDDDRLWVRLNSSNAVLEGERHANCVAIRKE